MVIATAPVRRQPLDRSAVPRHASDRVFVYGATMRGHRRHAAMAGARFVTRSKLARGYVMRRVEDEPESRDAAVHEATPGLAVEGELYEADRPTLEQLDRLMGVPEVYRRKRVETEHGPAWCYLMPSRKLTGRPVIPFGRWTDPAFSRQG